MEAGTMPIMIFAVLLVPIVGFMMAITPYLMRKNECFAVTVPEAAQKDPYLAGLKRRYALITMLVTIVFTALGVLFAVLENEVACMTIVVVGTLVLCGFSYVLMLFFRSKVQAYKKSQNWVAAKQEAVAAIGNERVPQALSLKWNLLYLVVIALTIGITFAGYSLMPDTLVMQVGADGEPTRWVDKTLLSAFFPVFIQGFMALCFVFSHWSIAHSKKYSNPDSPAASALAYGMFAHAQSLYILIVGLLICVLMIGIPLSYMGIIPLVTVGILVAIGGLVAVIGAIGISVFYGQGGSRVFARMQDSSALPQDDDAYWKLGIFYYNPQDPSIFLLERFGIGWTVNWARPAVWAIVIAGLALIIAFIAAIFLIT